MDVETLEREALNLDRSARGRLAARLLDSLDDVTDPEIEQAWIDECSRRRKDFENGTAGGVSAEEVMQSARERTS